MTSKPFPTTPHTVQTATPRKLALYSNRNAPHNDAMDARVMRLMNKRRPRIAYIPAETAKSEADFEKTHDHYVRLGADLAVFFDPSDASGSITWNDALSCDAIHLSGGDTFAFLTRLRQWRGMPVLRDYVSRGGVLIGVSAGAILMGPSAEPGILAGDWPESETTDKSAIDLVDFHFWPHFDPARRLSSGQRRLRQRLDHLHACPDGAGIVVDGEAIEIFGDVTVTAVTAVSDAAKVSEIAPHTSIATS